MPSSKCAPKATESRGYCGLKIQFMSPGTQSAVGLNPKIVSKLRPVRRVYIAIPIVITASIHSVDRMWIRRAESIPENGPVLHIHIAIVVVVTVTLGRIVPAVWIRPPILKYCKDFLACIINARIIGITDSDQAC